MDTYPFRVSHQVFEGLGARVAKALMPTYSFGRDWASFRVGVKFSPSRIKGDSWKVGRKVFQDVLFDPFG